MHIQAKAKAAKSPPDLEAFLRVLSEPATPQNPNRQPVNIEGISGDDLETSGYVTFSFDHDRVQQVREWLEEAGLRGRHVLERGAGWPLPGRDRPNDPGQLLAAVRAATQQNLASGRIIKTALIGQETQSPNRSLREHRLPGGEDGLSGLEQLPVG